MPAPLSTREKVLYHQIHPLKLATDVATSFASTWLLWGHAWLLGALVAWVPSIVVTAAMVRWGSFVRQRDSAFGRYVARYMTRLAEAVRLVGQLGAWVGAWLHAPWMIATGIVVIVAAWTYPLARRS